MYLCIKMDERPSNQDKLPLNPYRRLLIDPHKNSGCMKEDLQHTLCYHQEGRYRPGVCKKGTEGMLGTYSFG